MGDVSVPRSAHRFSGTSGDEAHSASQRAPGFRGRQAARLIPLPNAHPRLVGSQANGARSTSQYVPQGPSPRQAIGLIPLPNARPRPFAHVRPISLIPLRQARSGPSPTSGHKPPSASLRPRQANEAHSASQRALQALRPRQADGARSASQRAPQALCPRQANRSHSAKLASAFEQARSGRNVLRCPTIVATATQ
jgi:hypothetical protein